MQPHPTAPQLPPTTTHHEWLEQRRHGIGSSDASIIVGLSNWESPYTLWEQKTGRTPLNPPVDHRTQELRDWGNRLEPLILQATAEHLGTTIYKPDTAYHRENTSWCRANLDGWAPDRGRIAEWKNVSSFLAWQWDNQIPDHAEIQVHHAALVTGSTEAIIGGLIGGNRLTVHEITLNPNVLEMLFDAETKFWHHVETDTPPDIDGHVRTMESLTKEWAHNPGAVEVDTTDAEPLWEAYHAALEAEKEAAKAKKEAQAKLTALMNGHEALATGNRVWARARPGRLNLKRLTADNPDLVEEYTTHLPAFDTEAFKTDHPDIYSTYQHISVIPTKKESL